MSTDADVQGTRSPRYPRFSLIPSIGYAKRLYEGAHRSTVETLTAYKVMGFAGKSGASATALGAARQYGLVEGVKGGVRISDLGLAILEPASVNEYVNALELAAYHPPVFKMILDRFEGALPRSDEPIRSFLIRSLEFSKKGADECISSLRDTITSLKQDAPEPPYSAKPEDARMPAMEAARRIASEQVGDEGRAPSTYSEIRTVDAPPNSEIIKLRLTKACAVEIKFIGTVSDAALKRLISHIELLQDVWDDS